MANAKKCDKCGRLYEFYEGIDFGKDEYKYNWLRLFTTHGATYKTYDLCPTCMTRVIAFLNNHNEFDTVVKNCHTCRHSDQCPGCITDSYEKWEAKDNGPDRQTT